MASNLQPMDLVWHPDYSMRIVVDVELGEPHQQRFEAAYGTDGVWTMALGGLLEDDLRYFNEHELARVGEG